MDGKGTSSLSLSDCTERMSPVPHNLEQEQENRCGKVWLPLRLRQTFMCLLSMRTTTCKTFTQSKKKKKKKVHLMLAAFHFLSNLISNVYNYMLIFVIASLLLWCGELVSRRLLVRSLQSSPPVCPSAGLFTPSCSKGIEGPCNKSTVSYFG